MKVSKTTQKERMRRYAKRKAKEKILSQKSRAYYRNLNFRENPNEQAEASPEDYAAQNASLYGRKYADTVKAQGRKLFIQQAEGRKKTERLRMQGLKEEAFSHPSSEGFSWQPAEKRAGMQKNGRTTTSSIKPRQNLQTRRKKQAHISSVLREKGYSDRKYTLPVFSRKAKERSAAGVKTAKRLSRGTKKVISLILTGGGAMLLLLAVIIPLCAAAAALGSDDDSEVNSNNALVAIAQSQIGNEGGETYCRWYGFEDHVDWCAIFVSWCGDQAGMLETDSLPKYAVCDEGIRWFIKKGKWYSRRIEPKAGMIIFFDWDDDGVSEHTGIVEKCEDGIVYTIEGNSHDVCKRKWYAIGDKTIIGYGAAVYENERRLAKP